MYNMRLTLLERTGLWRQGGWVEKCGWASKVTVLGLKRTPLTVLDGLPEIACGCAFHLRIPELAWRRCQFASDPQHALGQIRLPICIFPTACFGARCVHCQEERLLGPAHTDVCIARRSVCWAPPTLTCALHGGASVGHRPPWRVHCREERLLGLSTLTCGLRSHHSPPPRCGSCPSPSGGAASGPMPWPPGCGGGGTKIKP
eukprot:365612-Chlamydomonas_euryale.AAC.1